MYKLLFGYLLFLAACATTAPAPGETDGPAEPGWVADAASVPVSPDSGLDAPLGLEFGDPCDDKTDCVSDICIFMGAGGVCSKLCAGGSCPMGFGCYGVLGVIEPGAVVDVCVPLSDDLCSPCGDSSECGAGVQNLCVQGEEGQGYCAQDCTAVECPAGYVCTTLDRSGIELRQCLPASGACDCNASNVGAEKSCVVATPFGPCAGSRTCNGKMGWSACEPPSPEDLPDSAYEDENCDGIDGTIAGGIFVAPAGTDSMICGATYLDPCRSIGRGILRALMTSRAHVYVQAGTYAEVATMQNNVNIWGGYDENWQRGDRGLAGHEVTIQGGLDPDDGQFMTIKARDLLVATTLADLVIVGPHATGVVGGSGRSSYAIHVQDGSAPITLARVTIVAMDGASGTSGIPGESAPNVNASAAMHGTSGGSAAQVGHVCESSSRGAGGAPGANTCSGGLGPNGGAGGRGGTADTSCSAGQCLLSGNCDATAGENGKNATQVVTSGYGYRGSGGAGTDTCGPGGNGQAGRVQNGPGGAGGVPGGHLMGAYWYAFPGVAGAIGENGGGGGGGGGSGGCDIGLDSYGAGGGGGGAGGCRALSGGGGGGGGGGSFGIFAMSSPVVAKDCVIYRGNGGNGGNGGAGGRGQGAGMGGAGGSTSDDSKPGGAGGKGGHGGHGGGGGGGAGGVSYAIYSHDAVIAQTCLISGGSAGKGGMGGAPAPGAPPAEGDGNPGTLGASGVLAESGVCEDPARCD